MSSLGSSVCGYVLLLVVQIVLIIVFGFFTNYSEEILPKNGNATEGLEDEKPLAKYPRECYIEYEIKKKNL